MGNASSSDQIDTAIAVTAVPIDDAQVNNNIEAVVATPVTQSQSNPETLETGVSLSMSTEYSVYSSTSAVDTLVGVNLQAAPAPTDTDRAPVDCVVVSDVSGSMGGPKIELLKNTVKLLLDEFVAKDQVGLVTFDTEVKERFPLQSVSGDARNTAAHVVDSFSAGTSTNLSGGCFAGIQQLLDASNNKGHVKTVLLMTDGQANHGLRSAEQIIPVLTSMLEGSGISLHTFGYGSGHDSNLLRQISTAGNGSYYFVEGVDDIRSAFGDCLGGMLSVVAQNLEVELEALNGATITKIHHKNAKVLEANKRYRVPFADLYGDEQRDVLVSMKLKAGSSVKDNKSPEGQLLAATLKYIDVLAAKPVNKTTSIGACRASEVNPEEQVQNEKLSLQATRIRVAESLEAAKASAEIGDMKRARRMIEETRLEVKKEGIKWAGSTQAQEMLPVFEDDLSECASGLTSTANFQNVSHKMAYMAEGHQQQRCMESTVTPSLFGGGEQSLRKNAYRTKAKSSKASKFSGFS